MAGRVLPLLVPQGADAPGLVVGGPVLDAVAQPRGDRLCVLREGGGGIAHGPSPPVLKRLREIPVIEGDEGSDAGFEQGIDKSVVEVEPRGVHHALTGGHDSGPGDGESIGADPETAQEIDIFTPAVEVIAGYRGVGAVGDVAGVQRIPVPDRLAAPPVPDSSLNLLRGGGDTPKKPVGKCTHGHLGSAFQRPRALRVQVASHQAAVDRPWCWFLRQADFANLGAAGSERATPICPPRSRGTGRSDGAGRWLRDLLGGLDHRGVRDGG